MPLDGGKSNVILPSFILCKKECRMPVTLYIVLMTEEKVEAVSFHYCCFSVVSYGMVRTDDKDRDE